MQISDSVVVVSGGGSGLGLATVERLLKDGARIAIIDLPSSNGAEAARRLGDRVVFAPADVTDESQVSAALDIAEAHGEIRSLVHTAGMGRSMRVLGRNGVFPLDVFSQVVTINLIGTFNVLRLTAERMNALEPLPGEFGDERGVIVLTSSVAAYEGQIGQAAYAASKAGVAGMTLPIARDLANRQIRVVTIAPGTFDTPLLAKLPQDARDALGAQVPHPSRLGNPAEFASLAAHIIDNAMLNGEVIRLDGAIRMAPR
ncbi:NAD(P)-dependent dehydrogenase (short-subunit alcohol dehydrogenase family) [Leucobacter exalbidus]|uniref:NAD(P)-dependent dehydrogenase (Short-subunit alcohol dehydrogenase family) n=1 Tax=Leucobacter exalbidus TaxID=662960 RepID=A0A940T6S1_9MICO|nr:SDR family NAD(P)-dependent oxidoreductase [Leucobacter exalbidus]MBP1327286.1 NAD(P)-dependent dehydrogenase (short-subunit alcohol dehydrogenase family) [Leucobacter exalbidus]